MIGRIRAVATYGPAVGTEDAEGSWRGWPASGGTTFTRIARHRRADTVTAS